MKYEDYTGNGNRPPTQAAQVQSDVDTIRSEMSHTLMELEERFSLREIMDEVFSSARRARSGSGDFLKNLGGTLRDHPIPVLLIGAGVASLLASERTSKSQVIVRSEKEGSADAEPGGDGELKGRASEMKEEASHTATQMKERASQATEHAKERAGQAAGRMKERAGDATDRVKETASKIPGRLSDSMHRARDRSREVIHDQPLVLAGLGMAIGALLAAAPMTETERRTMGTKRDQLKRSAEDRARDAVERARQNMDEGTAHGHEIGTEPAGSFEAQARIAQTEDFEQAADQSGSDVIVGPSSTERH
jgi:ElaB/YqjD/DUF883 family membrane-anchored ribosome-binding protein